MLRVCLGALRPARGATRSASRSASCAAPFPRNARSSAPRLVRPASPQLRARAFPSVAMASTAGVSSEATPSAVITVYRQDYQPVPYTITTVGLEFVLHEESTVARSTLSFERTPAAGAGSPPLELAGSPELELVALLLDGVAVPPSSYERSAKGGLVIRGLPSTPGFTLSVETRLKPQDNTSLEGLYKSSGNYCTQCEAEGFRRISFFLDRPDVMSVYTTRIEADKSKYPVLLGNGNLVSSGDLGKGRHFAVWEDPWPKPCYLFALVAGDLALTKGAFTTASGRAVELRIYTQAHNADKTAHALTSLIKSMAWDETRFGLEYDLDLFNIVAVDDFNMGAMENKSLNIFNSRLVLATPATATDSDYAAIESVVAHEYFHNWTGNRVTCRDWFQLSLKEGLTVYRDQEFSADMNSRGVQRISDVSRLRASQFPQDSGPMAHSIRPDSYVKMDNFYTTTVYEKGAEVVRMYDTLLGRGGFRAGMDLYFKRHDGQAVTCDDFLAAMADANADKDLSGFDRWYSQAGTPVLTVRFSYDPQQRTVTLACSQRTAATPGQSDKAPMVLPIAVGLLGADGRDLALTLSSGEGRVDATGSTAVLRMSGSEATFVFSEVQSRPVPSLLRGFSAPVKLETEGVSEEDLVFLLAHDSDPFNRWEAGQTLGRRLLLRLLASHAAGEPLAVPPAFTAALRSVLVGACAPGADKAFAARCLSLPSESELAEAMTVSDPLTTHAVRKFLVKSLAQQLQPELQAALRDNTAPCYDNTPAARAARVLKNTALAYLASLATPDIAAEAARRFEQADNMSDSISALAALASFESPQRTAALASFADKWAADPLVMNKWFGLQGGSDLPGNVANVRSLLSHPSFDIKNPNKVYSLIGAFCGCAVNFHAADGTGYVFLADIVLQLDALNAQVAARMVSGFTRWRKYDTARQQLMRAQLERIVSAPGLSDNVMEIASKSLAA